jgi:hypothetical protein
MATISAADMLRFHRNAPGALARRGGGYIGEALANSFELLVMGLVPIVGMLRFEWSATQLLVFLLAGAWIGIFCDVARVMFAGRGVEEFAKTHYDDWHVWVVVAALRFNRTEAPRSHLEAKHQPGAGVFVDLVAGGVGTAVILAMLGATGIRGEGPIDWTDRGWLASLAGFAAWQIGAAAWEIIRHRRLGPTAGPVQATPGARGAGLFILMFVTMMVGDPEERGGVDARRMMLVVNGALVLIGVLNTASIVWLRSETVWLRNYLNSRPQAPAAVVELTGAKSKKKRRKRR